MTITTREGQLVDAFVTLADTLVVGYDVVDLLQTLVESCRDILDVTAAGILLADRFGRLEVVASTSEESKLVEVMQIDADEGPCLECFSTGKLVAVPDVDAQAETWPRFHAEAQNQGFHGVFAVPLRLRNEVIGTLNLLRTSAGDMTAEDLRAAQALADVATIGILHERVLRDSDTVRSQLQSALGTRVVIEQAKGFLAHTNRISPEDAFQLLRSHSRSNNIRLADVAQAVLDSSLTL